MKKVSALHGCSCGCITVVVRYRDGSRLYLLSKKLIDQIKVPPGSNTPYEAIDDRILGELAQWVGAKRDYRENQP